MKRMFLFEVLFLVSVAFLSNGHASDQKAIPVNADPDPHATQGWSCKIDFMPVGDGCETDEMRQKRLTAETFARQRQQATELAERQKQQAAKAAENRSQLATLNAFRSQIKTESETNCGPVIAVRGNLIQVYFPVSGYGNEHWIRRHALYPPGFGCRFINGQYVTPE